MVDLPLPVGPVTRMMPLGAWMFWRKALEHVLGEAQVFEVQRDAAGVEHADDGLLAVGGGEGAHAEVDLAAFEHHVDAAVLRQPPLADVHRRP